ncbi:Atu4866 domain-containing protein [Tsukamurella sp. TY48]|uniref:Atu4866 domain-containing protein n=1 Tax=Tsukamurella sp. TY48 TaxID=2775495 RepID=UPI001C7DECDC|nr:Atu4866 domain-containing protein [Tsukamurella sp. TY48]
MTVFLRHCTVAVAVLIMGGAAAGCSSGSDSGSSAGTVATTAAVSSAPAGSSAASAAAAPIPANVPGTYSNGDWVVRLKADGTWEEDLNGRTNAYGGNYTVDGGTIVLRDRGGSSETATLSGDELKLPSITLRRQ